MAREQNPYAAGGNRPGVRHFLYAFLAVHAVLFPLSGFRAWVQVYSLDLWSSSKDAAPGTRIVAKVATSGRIGIAVNLTARQGSNSLLLGSKTIPSNRQAIYDPRSRRDSLVVILDDRLLRELGPGSISIVATATGRPQFTRLPPPVVKHLTMDISH